MNWAKTKNAVVLPLKDIPAVPASELTQGMKSMMESGKRPVMFFAADPSTVYAVFADDDDSSLCLARSVFPEGKRSYESLSRQYPCFYLFEREIYEDSADFHAASGSSQEGIVPEGHPSLNPVRKIFGAGKSRSDHEIFSFAQISGEEVHEVGVGPVHAGIIEPGHFRFSCLGETIHNMEIHLGYQHRGVEKLMTSPPSAAPNFRMQLAQSIAGDSVAGHGIAYAQLSESLLQCEVPARAHAIRAIALELERAAIHTGDLAALSNDIAYLPGNAVFGALRTIIINTLLILCGSRFARNLIKEGGAAFDITPELGLQMKRNIADAKKKISRMCSILFSSPGVLARFESTGIVSRDDARLNGLVGPAARASGLSLDVRSDHPHGMYAVNPFHKFTLSAGDVFARAYIRSVEINRSLEYAEELLDNLPSGDISTGTRDRIVPESICVSLVEGWRGEIAHCAITGSNGEFTRYKIKDPSFNNWRGLELAVQGNGISDFPLCNKSFNLSYCGFDL